MGRGGSGIVPVLGLGRVSIMFQDYKIAYLRKHVRVREATPLSFLRQSVAYVLSESARRIPHAAVIIHFDVTPLVEYGKSKNEEGSDSLDPKGILRRALNRNFSAFFIKTFAHALHHVPQMNGFLDYSPLRNGGTLYQAADINLSFTVHTKFGVIKPIVRNPHQKDLDTVAQEMRTLARKARRTDANELYMRTARTYVGIGLRELDFRALPAMWIWLRSALFSRAASEPSLRNVPEDEKLQVSDILGATCTIANIGMMFPGHQTVTVIIPPEVAMFGIGNLHLAPAVVDGKIVPRYVVTMSGTIDHRAYDGGEVFPIQEHIQRYIDNPALIYDWKPGDPV